MHVHDKPRMQALVSLVVSTHIGASRWFEYTRLPVAGFHHNISLLVSVDMSSMRPCNFDGLDTGKRKFKWLTTPE